MMGIGDYREKRENLGFHRKALFCRVTFLMFLPVQVQVAQSLIDFSDGVPASAILQDAPLLHEQIDQVFLLPAYFAEVMQKLPNVHVEVIFDAFDHGPFACLCDMVVVAWVVGLAVRDLDGHLSLLFSGRDGHRRERYCDTLKEFALDGATTQGDRVVAAVTVDEPLAQIRRHFQVYAVFAHTAKIQHFRLMWCGGARGLRNITFVCHVRGRGKAGFIFG